jgi:8-oxo-dGTP pyrophosphatase MutT (NUDIX family)
MACPADPRVPFDGPLRAAAVCFRRSDGYVQFLLVRTRRGQGWTFPKGHIEPRETPRNAAVREAREEGGVVGAVQGDALTRFRYPALTTAGMPTEVCVEAYLLRVDSQASPTGRERLRAPMWFGPEEALALLSQNQEPRFGRENRRLMRLALARIGAAERGR